MLLVPAASAQELVLHKFIGREPDAQFEELLYLTAGVELSRRNLSSIRDSDTADMMLTTWYSTDDGMVALSYSLARATDPGTDLAAVVLTTPMDPSLDAAVAGAVGRLFDAAGIHGTQWEAAVIHGLLEEPPATPKLEPVPLPAALTQAAHATAAGKRPAFTASASTAGIMFVGDAMDYFRYGAGGTLGAGFSWRRPSRSLSLESGLSFNRAFNDSGTVGGPLYLGTAGLGFGIGTGTDKAHGASAAIFGGAAFLTVVGTSAVLTKTVPYAELATSMSIPLGVRLSLGFALRFMAVIDPDITIMGVSPAVTIRMER